MKTYTYTGHCKDCGDAWRMSSPIFTACPGCGSANIVIRLAEVLDSRPSVVYSTGVVGTRPAEVGQKP